MDYSQILEKAAAYTQKFVDAAIPVAQKAYEIGLLTIQIDALQQIFIGIVAAAVSAFLLWKLLAHKKQAQSKADEWNESNKYVAKSWESFSPFDDAGYGITFATLSLPAVLSIFIFGNVWLWVKLFKPELWLAKQAIEAVMSHVAK